MEPGAEASGSGSSSRRSYDGTRLAAGSALVTRERPGPSDVGRSSAIQVPSSPSEVGGRLGTLTWAGMERWRGRLALVTGASGGIGAAVARALVQHGLKVVGCARTVGNIEVSPRWGASRPLGPASFPLGQGPGRGWGVAGARLSCCLHLPATSGPLAAGSEAGEMDDA